MLPASVQTPATSLPSTFADIGLTDYLDHDPRPTFAIRLTADPVELTVVYANSAFRHVKACDEIARISLVSRDDSLVDAESHDFVNWIKGLTSEESFKFRDLIWTAVSLHQEWRIVSGIGALESDQCPENHVQGNGFIEKGEPRTGDELFAMVTSSGAASLEHCRLVQNFNWTDNSLGPVSGWPWPLLHIIPTMFCNPDPCCIFWGKERILIYNESYVTLIRDYHPRAMGASAKVVWNAFWKPFEALIQEIEKTKQAVRHEEVRVLLNRSIDVEETFFSYTFVPILDSNGQVCGILDQGVEVTKQVVAQRRINDLIKIAEATSHVTTIGDFWRGTLSAVQTCQADLPFFAIYTLDNDLSLRDSSGGRSSRDSEPEMWYLEGSIGFNQGHPATSNTINASDDTGLAFALKRASESSAPLLFQREDGTLPESMFKDCTDRGAGSTFSQLVICPFYLSTEKVAACIALGVNPLQPYDEEYVRFTNLLSRQIEDTAASVVLLQREKRHLQKTVEQAEYQRQWLSEQLRQQTREAQESDLRFYNFAKQAPVGVYILGSQGEIKFCNDAWYKLVGVPVGYQGPVPWRIHVHPDDLEAVDEQWQLLVDGHSQSDFEWRAIRDPGAEEPHDDVVHLRSSCFPELAEDGSMKTVTGILMDLTLNKAHERAAADRLTSALEAKRAQENFMDMVSHEMRNPLNAMLQCAGEASELLGTLTSMMSSSLQESDVLSDTVEAIDTIQYCGRHQKQIIDDVLTVSKLDSNLLTLSPVEASPINVMDQAVKIFASEIRASDIKISRKLSPDDSRLPCLIDSGRVLQILINLVGNAIKFTKERPTRTLSLSVSTSKTKPRPVEVRYVPSGRQRQHSTKSSEWGAGDPIYVYFSVTDTGPGLTSVEMDTLFARFKQASPRTHAQYGGSGLGLFISRELAELHGGEIGLASTVDKGSTFAFYIEGRRTIKSSGPAQLMSSNNTVVPSIAHRKKPSVIVTSDEDLSKSQQQIGSASPQIPQSQITILIVEDNLVNQKVLERQLKRLGYKTVTANNGQEALDTVQNSTWWLTTTTPQHMPPPTSPLATTTINKDDSTRQNLSIILCDLEMPVMDGITCARRIRQWQRDGFIRAPLASSSPTSPSPSTKTTTIPMVAVTGNARTEQIDVAREAGFDAVVCKPYSVPEIIPLVQKLCLKTLQGA